MRILICDDDTNIIQQLQNYIIEYFGNVNLKVPEIIAFEQGEALLAAATADDIIFLDIELPDKSGIYVGRELKNRYKDLIIFIITSYTEYLDDAMRFSIFRYILKPIDKKRLFRNMKDALFCIIPPTLRFRSIQKRLSIQLMYRILFMLKHRDEQ